LPGSGVWRETRLAFRVVHESGAPELGEGPVVRQFAAAGSSAAVNADGMLKAQATTGFTSRLSILQIGWRHMTSFCRGPASHLARCMP